MIKEDKGAIATREKMVVLSIMKIHQMPQYLLGGASPQASYNTRPFRSAQYLHIVGKAEF
jgi:hypothetical protein